MIIIIFDVTKSIYSSGIISFPQFQLNNHRVYSILSAKKGTISRYNFWKMFNIRYTGPNLQKENDLKTQFRVRVK